MTLARSSSIAKPFLINGEPADIWEADRVATELGSHVDILWPVESAIADAWLEAQDRPTRLSSSFTEEEWRHMRVLMETGHQESEVRTLFSLSERASKRLVRPDEWAQGA